MIKLYLTCDIPILLSTLPVRHWRMYTEGKACRYYCIMIFKLSHISILQHSARIYIRTCTRGIWGPVAKEEPGAHV